MSISESDGIESRRRSHLANERTFLAWLRTGLTIAALGLASAQFIERQAPGGIPLIPLLSLLLVFSGIGIITLGWHRYRLVRQAIDGSDVHTHAGAALTGIAFAAIVAGVVAGIIAIMIEVRA